MTRAEAIDRIARALPNLDDDRLRDVAELVESVGSDSSLPRPLSDHEHALLDRSREDFRHGRTLTSAAARASIDEELAKFGVPKSSA